jgi:hypothetical protein
MVDPAFHPTDVTRNRFQYLADQIAQYGVPDFEPIGMAEGLGAGQFIEFAALYNSTAQVKKLSGLTVTVSLQSSAKKVAMQVFFATPSSALVIPARTVYFARLSFAHFRSPPKTRGNSVSYNVHFHFAHFTSCRGQVCVNS